MLQLTKRTEYGLIALTVLAAREGEVVSVREIAERYPLPRRLLAEALKDLCRADLIESQRGAQGGYTLTRKADSVTVGEIVSALEGAPSMTSCASLGAAASNGTCDMEPDCPIRSPIHRLRADIWALFQRTTLRDLSDHPPLGVPRPAAN